MAEVWTRSPDPLAGGQHHDRTGQIGGIGVHRRCERCVSS
jgi:hypothetical protein